MPQWSAEDVRANLRVPLASDDKYARGVLGVFTGSAQYPGAAVLGVEAAARTGVGMIRYRGAAAESVLARRPETVTAAGRVHAWLIGSGVPALAVTEPVLAEAVASGAPLVLDAGALVPAVLELARAGGPRILTPHAGEAAALLGSSVSEVTANPSAAARQLAAEWDAVVVLKGSVTRVLSPAGSELTIGPATPWLATAGSGDVLAGIIAALVASAPEAELAGLAATGAWLHGAAAETASAGAPIVALDVAEAVPQVIRTVLA